MQKITKPISLVGWFVLVFAVGISSATTAPASKHSASNTTATHTQHKTTTASVKSKSKPMAKAVSKNKKMSDVLAPPEDLSGTIASVGISDKKLTLVGSNGVPYDFRLTKKTRIEGSNQMMAANELTSESQRQATVHFVPTARGNMADTIRIAGS